jgi:branched-chain amino acid transport system substrate-binding protein
MRWCGRRTRCSWSPAPRSPISPARNARPTPCIGPTTPGCSRKHAGALAKSGGDTWFFLTADYAFGHALERDTTAVVLANGGKVLGSVSHPLNNQDFSSFLLQAQQSKAKIIGLANAGGDTINAIKQGAEFGITAGGQQLRRLLVFIGDVEALG